MFTESSLTRRQNAFCSLLLILVTAHFSGEVLDAQEKEKPAKKTTKKEFRSFKKSGVSFDFPIDWNVSSDQSFSSTRLLIVSGPDNAIVTIQFTETSVADTLKDYAKEYSESAKDSLKSFKISGESMGKPTKKNTDGFRTITEKFSLSDPAKSRESLTVPHRRVFMKKVFGDYSCFLVAQAATSSQKKATRGFEMIARSLKWNKVGDN